MALENRSQNTNGKVIIQSHNGTSISRHQLRSGASQSPSAPPTYDLSIILQRSKNKFAQVLNIIERKGFTLQFNPSSRIGWIIHTQTENPESFCGPILSPASSGEMN